MRLKIEKLIYGGDGLARVPAEDGQERGKTARGKTVFVPYVLAGEVVEARVTEERKGFARASLVQVLEPSPERVAPPCPHFGVCGGCHYQHSRYAAQLEAKRAILRETLQRGTRMAAGGAGLELPPIEVHAAHEYGFRNRTRMKIATRPEFALGYRRHGSHALEVVHECAISSPLIQRAIGTMWDLAGDAEQFGALREVQFFANDEDRELLVELRVAAPEQPERLRKWARRLREQMPEIAGVAVTSGIESDSEPEADGSRSPGSATDRRATRLQPPSPAGAPLIEGAAALHYRVDQQSYRVSAGSFFQTNRFLVEKLVELVTSERGGESALDLYAGVGLFTLPLATTFARVTAVEIGSSSFGDLAVNSAAHPGIRAVCGGVEDFLKAARREHAGRWDFAVADPPRAGLGERAVRLLAGLGIPRLALVSCDPATLARDVAVLAESGYRVEEAHLVDMFPQSFHLETVLHLAR